MEKALGLLKERLIQQRPQRGTSEEIKRWLDFVADLGDSSLVPYVRGYLIPPHADQKVRHSALNAIASMRDPVALDVVKQFVKDTAPEGETLVVARRARLALEQRNDMDLFDSLAKFYDPDADVLDPAINYEPLLGRSLRISVTQGLEKSSRLWDDGHWDEFITKIDAIMGGLVQQVFRTQHVKMSLDQQRAQKLAGGNSYASMLAVTEFRTAYGRLQAYCNTIHGFRADSPTAHVLSRDGSAKVPATEDDAEVVRREFQLAFAEAIRALR